MDLNIIPVIFTVILGVMLIWFAYQQIPKDSENEK